MPLSQLQATPRKIGYTFAHTQKERLAINDIQNLRVVEVVQSAEYRDNS